VRNFDLALTIALVVVIGFCMIEKLKLAAVVLFVMVMFWGATWVFVMAPG
jgi:hypothetical protein